MEIDTFYQKLQYNRIYEFGEIIIDYPDFIQYAMKSLESTIGSKSNSNNFTIKVTEILPTNKIIVHSLITETLFAESYKEIIPENGLGYIGTLKKESEEVIYQICEVYIPTYEQKIKIRFELKRISFQLTNKQNINFPEDYFLKGYGILGETISTEILNGYVNKNDFVNKKNQYAEIKALCLYRIQEKLQKKAA